VLCMVTFVTTVSFNENKCVSRCVPRLGEVGVCGDGLLVCA
jgi:hypothetical protein